MKEIEKCPICSNDTFETLYHKELQYQGINLNLLDINNVRNYILFNDIVHSKDAIRFNFKICTNCGIIFFIPRPEEIDMAIKYKITSDLGDVDEREKIRYKISYDDERSLAIYRFINNIRPIYKANIIDLGGGHGFNLKYFLKENSCYVVDYIKQDLFSGVKYLCRTIEEVSDSFHADLILYCHTLEHVINPVEEILRIKKTLLHGGLLYIEVPFGCCNEYKSTSNFLTHVNFFSTGSLYYLLNKCGFSIKYLKVKPTMIREGFDLVIVALAENSKPNNLNINAFKITKTQMNANHYHLRIHQKILNIKLMKFRGFLFYSDKLKRSLGTHME